MAFADLRGGMNNHVLVLTRSGLSVRRKPRYKYPVDPAVREGSLRLEAAAAIYSTFSASEAAAWRRYAASLARLDPVTGKRYSPAGRNIFMGLAIKFQQVNPGAEVPRTPPVGDFMGDTVSVSASVEGGAIRFTASHANTPGVTTELMLQRLKNVRCMPGKVYKAAAFVAFAPGSLAFDVDVEPGVYAAAIRFVETATGRQTFSMPLPGVLEVG
jgi:hypothetical protein